MTLTKHILGFLFLNICFLLSQTAGAESQSTFSIGFSLNPNISQARVTMYDGDKVSRLSNFHWGAGKEPNVGRFSLNVGLVAKQEFTDRIAIRFGVFLADKGTKSYSLNSVYTFHDRFIDIPVEVFINHSLNERLRLFLLSGLSFNIRTQTYIHVKDENNNTHIIDNSNIIDHPDHLSRYCLSFIGGFGVSYSIAKFEFFIQPVFKRDLTSSTQGYRFNAKLFHYYMGIETGVLYKLSWRSSEKA